MVVCCVVGAPEVVSIGGRVHRVAEATLSRVYRGKRNKKNGEIKTHIHTRQPSWPCAQTQRHVIYTSVATPGGDSRLLEPALSNAPYAGETAGGIAPFCRSGRQEVYCTTDGFVISGTPSPRRHPVSLDDRFVSALLPPPLNTKQLGCARRR